MKKAIEANNLSFKYNDKKVLSNVSFSINEGEIVLLTGSSGEGKSTLIYLLSGIIPNLVFGELDGEILINGETILNKKVSEICKEVGIVLQNAENQITHKHVDDELAFGAENLGIEPQIIKQKIDLISKIMALNPNDTCKRLSGGQKQKLITGSTLLMGQKIVILDEPLANLDKEAAHELMRTLIRLSKNKFTVLIVEHRIDLLLNYVNRVLKIESQKVIEIQKDELIKERINSIIKVDIAKEPCKNPLFLLNNVSFKANNKLILKDLTFKINKGERVLLLGDNGVGKTTLLRIIGKLIKFKKGEYISYLKDELKFLNKPNKKWFKKVGIIYQNPNYQLFMKTVKEEIYFNAFSSDYANYIITLFGIENLLNCHPQSLSEGQKRKVSIASILAMKPEVLLLDEPTVGQDYESLEKLILILNKIHIETGNTMISITHDKRCAEALTDRAFLLKKNNLLIEGDVTLVRDYFKY